MNATMGALAAKASKLLAIYVGIAGAAVATVFIGYEVVGVTRYGAVRVAELLGGEIEISGAGESVGVVVVAVIAMQLLRVVFQESWPAIRSGIGGYLTPTVFMVVGSGMVAVVLAPDIVRLGIIVLGLVFAGLTRAKLQKNSNNCDASGTERDEGSGKKPRRRR